MKRPLPMNDASSNTSWLGAELAPLAQGALTTAVSTALVLEASAEDRVRVRLDATGSITWGTIAMAPAPQLGVGDRVVVAVDGAGAAYILGQLGSKLRLSTDAKTGATKLSSEGSLVVESVNGDVALQGRTARVRATETLELDAGSGKDQATFTLGGALASLSARVMKVTAKQADIGIASVGYVGEQLRTKLDEAKLTVSRMETAAEQIFERAKDVFRTVEDLHQVKAGRSRTIVKNGYFVRGGHTTIEAAEDVKIDGKQIHLG